jgi:hypothetical protein
MEFSNAWKEFKSSFEDLKQSVALLRECDDCTKGPCVSRLLRGEEGWTHPMALYVVGSHTYIKRCSILMRKPELAIKLERSEHGIIAYYLLDAPIQEENVVGYGDIPVEHLVVELEERP